MKRYLESQDFEASDKADYAPTFASVADLKKPNPFSPPPPKRPLPLVRKDAAPRLEALLNGIVSSENDDERMRRFMQEAICLVAPEFSEDLPAGTVADWEAIEENAHLIDAIGARIAIMFEGGHFSWQSFASMMARNRNAAAISWNVQLNKPEGQSGEPTVTIELGVAKGKEHLQPELQVQHRERERNELVDRAVELMLHSRQMGSDPAVIRGMLESLPADTLHQLIQSLEEQNSLKAAEKELEEKSRSQSGESSLDALSEHFDGEEGGTAGAQTGARLVGSGPQSVPPVLASMESPHMAHVSSELTRFLVEPANIKFDITRDLDGRPDQSTIEFFMGKTPEPGLGHDVVKILDEVFGDAFNLKVDGFRYLDSGSFGDGFEFRFVSRDGEPSLYPVFVKLAGGTARYSPEVASHNLRADIHALQNIQSRHLPKILAVIHEKSGNAESRPVAVLQEMILGIDLEEAVREGVISREEAVSQIKNLLESARQAGLYLWDLNIGFKVGRDPQTGAARVYAIDAGSFTDREIADLGRHLIEKVEGFSPDQIAESTGARMVTTPEFDESKAALPSTPASGARAAYADYAMRLSRENSAQAASLTRDIRGRRSVDVGAFRIKRADYAGTSLTTGGALSCAVVSLQAVMTDAHKITRSSGRDLHSNSEESVPYIGLAHIYNTNAKEHGRTRLAEQLREILEAMRREGFEIKNMVVSLPVDSYEEVSFTGDEADREALEAKGEELRTALFSEDGLMGEFSALADQVIFLSRTQFDYVDAEVTETEVVFKTNGSEMSRVEFATGARLVSNAHEADQQLTGKLDVEGPDNDVAADTALADSVRPSVTPVMPAMPSAPRFLRPQMTAGTEGETHRLADHLWTAELVRETGIYQTDAERTRLAEDVVSMLRSGKLGGDLSRLEEIAGRIAREWTPDHIAEVLAGNGHQLLTDLLPPVWREEQSLLVINTIVSRMGEVIRSHTYENIFRTLSSLTGAAQDTTIVADVMMFLEKVDSNGVRVNADAAGRWQLRKDIKDLNRLGLKSDKYKIWVPSSVAADPAFASALAELTVQVREQNLGLATVTAANLDDLEKTMNRKRIVLVAHERQVDVVRTELSKAETSHHSTILFDGTITAEARDIFAAAVVTALNPDKQHAFIGDFATATARHQEIRDLAATYDRLILIIKAPWEALKHLLLSLRQTSISA
ncbi:MAG: hypothetical protein HQL11_05025 [Candidatus Omnitrophica bacterium]|nr:hypothetical protein [Candidatus Omnitrophota bacterium]